MFDEELSGGDRRPDFASVLRRGIRERGVTLTWLRTRLSDSGNPVSAATLSYWRSGARRPEGAHSIAAVEELESLLHLEPGALVSRIGPTQRVGPIGPAQYPLEVGGVEVFAAETLAALGAAPVDTARDVTTTAVTEVAADGAVISRTTRTLLQSISGTITHVPYLELTPGLNAPAPVFTVVSGGRVSGLHSHPSGEVHGAMFELERPVGPAQTTMIEWSLTFPPGYPAASETGHGVARRVRELVLWTRFRPDALPDWIDEVEETATGQRVTPLFLDGATSIHQVRQGWGPGMLLLRWGFGQRPTS